MGVVELKPGAGRNRVGIISPDHRPDGFIWLIADLRGHDGKPGGGVVRRVCEQDKNHREDAARKTWVEHKSGMMVWRIQLVQNMISPGVQKPRREGVGNCNFMDGRNGVLIVK